MVERKPQNKTIEKKKFIAKHLKKGKLPRQVIELVMEEYGIAHDTAYQLVYAVNKDINDSLKELSDNAAQYLLNNLQALAAEAMDDGDRKSAIKSYELLMKLCKVGQEETRTDININFGFDFSDIDKDDHTE